MDCKLLGQYGGLRFQRLQQQLPRRKEAACCEHINNYGFRINLANIELLNKC